ncbi:MAG: type IV pilin protein [Gammaproteobacteria bacterium]|nr:type IV pilin protein [Gammaproteobacteria bacterium]
MHRRAQGFTLIEFMIVVVVIGLLAAIAIPNYRESVAAARRVDAQAALMELAQFMERYYTAHGKYRDGSGNPPALPFTESPKTGLKVYNLRLAATDSAYTLSAEPKDIMKEDRCGTLQLTSAGVKGIVLDPPNPDVTVEQCWRR